VVIRPAQADDATLLGAVHVRIWRETYRGQMPDALLDGLNPVRSSEMWLRVIRQSQTDEAAGHRILVAEAEGEFVGFASSGAPRDDDPVRPLQLYVLNVVAPQYGTGLGQRLLEAAIGEEPAYLWVAEANSRAKRFYEKHGFRLDNAFQDDERLAIRELRMVR
jgi:ribosomal protein S18 acetylase RimI-like enzyme